MERVVDMDNLRESFLLAAKGKSNRTEVVAFRESLDAELLRLRCELAEGTYRFGHYRRFTVYDPKEREICAAPFRDRVTFHAMMRVCHAVFERFQMNVSYASRVGMGTYKAIEQAQRYSRSYRWFLKMDVCKYFDSVEHGCMKRQLHSLFKDEQLLRYFDTLIDTYHSETGRGLPIGNLTSQYFANHYLAVADHYAKERLGAKAMVRYMDDVVLWGNDKEELLCMAYRYRTYLEQELLLNLHPFCVNKTCHGMPFLGYVVYPHSLRLNQRSRRRYRRNVAALDEMTDSGAMSQADALQRITSMLSFVNKSRAGSFLRTVRIAK